MHARIHLSLNVIRWKPFSVPWASGHPLAESDHYLAPRWYISIPFVTSFKFIYNLLILVDKRVLEICRETSHSQPSLRRWVHVVLVNVGCAWCYNGSYQRYYDTPPATTATMVVWPTSRRPNLAYAACVDPIRLHAVAREGLCSEASRNLRRNPRSLVRLLDVPTPNSLSGFYYFNTFSSIGVFCTNTWNHVYP